MSKKDEKKIGEEKSSQERDLKKLLIEQNQKEVEMCNKEISFILEKYNCNFDFSITIDSSGRIIPRMMTIHR